jgi:7-cyano-7-deazaguanine synthase in queuosine biosynthesis
MKPADIPVFDSPVNILVSGGADSAILLYLLLQKYSNKIYIHTITNIDKGMQNVFAAINVVSKCIELTNNKNIEHTIHYRKAQSKADFYNIVKQRKTFIGITANPPESVLKTFKNNQGQESLVVRDPTIIKEEMPDSDFVLPWLNVDKRQIHEYYKNYNLLDTLFPITRSCEWISSMKVKNPGNKHCGECWWCEERKWAFERL